MDKIILIGFMGSGKTTVGGLLASLINSEFLDTDNEILRISNQKTIPEIFSKSGEEGFRKLEAQVAENAGRITDRIVIATGGGMVTSPANLANLKNNSCIIYLETKFENIKSRVISEMKEKDLTRPLFTDEKKAKDLYESRLEIYSKAADITISTDGKTPAQISTELLNLLRKKSPINIRENICMIIGSPVNQSLSPVMHNAGYKALGIDSQFKYISREITAVNLTDELKLLKSNPDLRGVSVTIPLKVDICEHLDEISETAQKIGAVNTILIKNGKWSGTNTDWLGVLNPLKENIPLEGKNVALFGAGGAARAACYAMKISGAKVTVFNRTLSKAEELAHDFNCQSQAISELKSLSEFDIIINSIPYKEAGVLIDPSYLEKNHVIFDMIYNPHKTPLTKIAETKGSKIIYGIEMLLNQGVEQFKIFTGFEAPVEIMRKSLMEEICR